MRAARQERGYSLYELLMTLVLISAVLGLGLPSLGDIVAGQRLRAELDRLFHAVHLARKASVARRVPVTLCASVDGRRCEPGGDWSRGWILFVDRDLDRPPQYDAGDVLLAARRLDARIEVRGNRAAFTFRATERRATNGTLVVCERSGRIDNRALVVSYTGRPRVARRDRGGNAYRCSG